MYTHILNYFFKPELKKILFHWVELNLTRNPMSFY